MLVKNPGVEQVYSLFCRLRDEGVWALRYLPREAWHRYAGDFSFVLKRTVIHPSVMVEAPYCKNP